MSGRLIILPKKSYTPWNAANVERVLHDERIAKEKIEKEEDESRRRARLQQIQEMKKKQACSVDESHDEMNQSYLIEYPQGDSTGVARHQDGDSETTETSTKQLALFRTGRGHINFFQTEEKKMVESQLLGKDGWKASEDSDTKSVGIMPIFLSDEKAQKRQDDRQVDKPFYVRKDCLRPVVDDRVKINSDPMSEFIRDEIEIQQNITRMTKTGDQTVHNDKECSDCSSSDDSRRKHKLRKTRRHKNKRVKKDHKYDYSSDHQESDKDFRKRDYHSTRTSKKRRKPDRESGKDNENKRSKKRINLRDDRSKGSCDEKESTPTKAIKEMIIRQKKREAQERQREEELRKNDTRF